jgi:ubiquinone/menaquinone biosynthesis C-methylase UbiE
MQSFQSLLGTCCGTNGNKPYKEVYKCDARSLDVYPDSFFNTIISNCALEHIDGIELALKSSYRVLNKKGKLIMTVPSPNLNRWFPESIKRFLFRVLLKKYYIQSQPIIDNGGELVIVAQKNEE